MRVEVLERGFGMEKEQKKYELTITAESVISTDDRFSMDNLGMGDEYKPLDVYFMRASGEIVRRHYNKGERRNSNQTMPRIAFQVFERQIASLSGMEREQFPIRRYKLDKEVICGIFLSVEEFRRHRNTLEYITYNSDSGARFVIYGWNIFSTIVFVQECLKRYGEHGDKFILSYREKDKSENGLS